MSNPNWGKVGGTRTNETNAYVKNLGSWTEFDEGYKKIGGSWTKFYDKYGGATDYVTVVLVDFDEFDECACNLTGGTQTWYTGGATLAVDDWVNDSMYCAKVTAINVPDPGAADSYVMQVNTSCADCNESLSICMAEGDGPEGGGYCLLPEMLVQLMGGHLRKVIDLEVGDLIQTKYGITAVTHLIKDHPRNGYYIIEDELYISDDHPILINGEMILAKNYNGNKKYVNSPTNTVYVGTLTPTFNVYCKNNIYVVDGQYRKEIN